MLDAEGLTVTRESSDERRVELTRLDNLLDVSKVAERNILFVDHGNQILHGGLLEGLLKLLNNSQVPLTDTCFVVLETLLDGSERTVEMISSAQQLRNTDLLAMLGSQKSNQVVGGHRDGSEH